ncbi:uncharacterized protein [Manis javanica]|uniref:uncharacterized protein n=1 Tax=Manis javanica TaxID=9974 RepID=UPI003C6DACC7
MKSGPKVSHLFQEVSECKQRKAHRSGVLGSKPRQRGRVAAEPARRKPLEGRASGERALPAGVRRAQHQPPPRHREARARSVCACARVKGWAGLRRASQAGPARASWEPAPSGRWFICLWAVPLCPALLRSPGVCSLPWPRQRVSRVVVAAIAVMEAFPTAAPSPGKLMLCSTMLSCDAGQRSEPELLISCAVTRHGENSLSRFVPQIAPELADVGTIAA